MPPMWGRVGRPSVKVEDKVNEAMPIDDAAAAGVAGVVNVMRQDRHLI